MARSLQATAICLLALSIPGCAPQASAETGLFHDGRSRVVAGHYDAAVPILQRYLSEHPQGTQASRAGLFLGKAFLAVGKHEEAKAAWEKTARDYPQSLEAHKCRYKLALLALLEDDRDSALQQFGQLADHPDGPLAAEATAMRVYLRKQLERDADGD